MSDNFFELDPTPDGPDKAANEQQLQEKLALYQKALQEEFEDGVKYQEGKLTPMEIRNKTKELMTQAVPKAVARLQYIIEHGQNESNQLKAAQYVIDKGLGKDVHGLTGDPLEELLAEINAKAASD